jgi:hypothetical protein
MTKKKKDSETFEQLRKRAALKVLKNQSDEPFQFNGKEHTVTVAQARNLLPGFINDSLSGLDRLIFAADRKIGTIIKKELTEEIEILESIAKL